MSAPPARPAVVAIGGGHGLSVTLRACAPWAGRLTAIVSVADDGGSSGRLRSSTGVPAMGDLRRCLTALASPERRVLAGALARRFEGGDLHNHPAGNVLLAALTFELGDLAAAAEELAGLLGVTASVVPSTTVPVDLVGRLGDGRQVLGQVAVEAAHGLVDVRVEPPDPAAPAAALEALAGADLVVLGPGSLYGSVLAAVTPAVRDALAASAARVAFVCNLRPRPPETEGYDVAAHLDALDRHGVKVAVAVVHDGGQVALGDPGAVEVVVADVARPHGLAHDPASLGAVLEGLATS